MYSLKLALVACYDANMDVDFAGISNLPSFSFDRFTILENKFSFEKVQS